MCIRDSHVFPCIPMYSHVFSCIRHVFACIVMYRSCIGHMYRSCMGLGPISPKCGVCIPPNVFCSIWRYFDVSEQSQVSVRIEEAFQIHAKNDRYRPQKKPSIGQVLSCIVHVSNGSKLGCRYLHVSWSIDRDNLNRVSNTCIVGRGRHTSSKPAKYMKYTHDTRANKMEEWRITIQVKKRAIHDDTRYWGKTDPILGEIRPLSGDTPVN